MTRLALAALAALAVAPAAARAAPEHTLTVAVAANMKPAFEELARAWEARHPGAMARAVYGASGTLAAQIENGAPLDLFLSADAALPAALARGGLTVGPPFTYAVGVLVVWVPQGSTLDLEHRGLRALADPSVRRIAIANPSLAPYGRAASEALRWAGLDGALAGRLVVGQSVAQAAQFAESGNAQAAFLPRSLAIAPPLSTEGRAWPVPAAAHAPIEQAGVVLRASREPALARDLGAFLLGPEGRAILERAGYRAPG